MNLENLGVQEMNTNDVKNVEGGFGGAGAFILGAIVGGAIYDGWKAFGTAYMKGAAKSGGRSVHNGHF